MNDIMVVQLVMEFTLKNSSTTERNTKQLSSKMFSSFLSPLCLILQHTTLWPIFSLHSMSKLQNYKLDKILVEKTDSYKTRMLKFRKSDPGNKLILGLESDPISKRARFKLILAN